QILDNLRDLAVASPGDEFRVALQEPEVDLDEALSEQLPAAIGRAAIAAPRKFDEARFRKVGPGPVQTVAEKRLIAAREHDLAFLWRDAQGLANLLLQPRNADLIITLPNRL